jgi:hypothetical protein
MPQRYFERHQGSAIIVGAAPSVFEDVAAARALRPDAVLLGSNHAASVFPEIKHVWTQHQEIAGDVKAKAPGVKVHAKMNLTRTKGGGIYFFGGKPDEVKLIDYEWPELAWVTGSSGFAAALWARHGLGYSEAILCGIPISPDSTVYSEEYRKFSREKWARDDTPGSDKWARVANFQTWHERIEMHIAAGKATGIVSMSGWTRDKLGAPA